MIEGLAQPTALLFFLPLPLPLPGFVVLGAAFTWVVAVAWLLAAFASAKVVVTDAVFEIEPVFFALTAIVAVAVTPALTVPSWQVTVLPARSQVPDGLLAEMNST